MHRIQVKIIDLAKRKNIADMGYRRIGAVIGVDHPQKVKWHLEKLLRDGKLVVAADGRPVPPEQQALFSNMLNIPVLGRANCGEPLQYAEEVHDDNIQVSKNYLGKSDPKDCFAVKVVGNSMNQADIQGQPINDGDIVIVDTHKKEPKSGDVVLVSIDGLATIKAFDFNPTRKRITLKAQSTQDYNPILLHEADRKAYQVHGQVIDVVPMSA